MDQFRHFLFWIFSVEISCFSALYLKKNPYQKNFGSGGANGSERRKFPENRQKFREKFRRSVETFLETFDGSQMSLHVHLVRVCSTWRTPTGVKPCRSVALVWYSLLVPADLMILLSFGSWFGLFGVETMLRWEFRQQARVSWRLRELDSPPPWQLRVSRWHHYA